MMYIVLTIIIIILSIVIISMKKQLRNIGQDIKESNGQYVNIHTNTIDKDIEFVVSQINYLYDENQKVNIIRKNTDEELKRSIANMSHDLRTPLTSIMGYMQLIKDDYVTDNEKKQYIEIVERRTKNLQDLISSFYDLSRLQSNDYKFNLEKVNLKSILSENLALFYSEFMNKDIEPNIDIDEEIPYIITDKNVVMRVFSNLINNMLKHGNGNVKISLKKEGKFIVSRFENYAPNLNEDDIERIFDRFYIGDTARSNNNTGLGLSITKSFVQQLGHEIESNIIENNLIISIKWKL